MNIQEALRYRTKWSISRWASEEDALAGKVYSPEEARRLFDCPQFTEFDGNLLLNEGIALAWDLIIGAGGTPFNNTNAYIGVGDSNATESATQTGLQASTNKLYKGMQTSYPSRSGQTVTWRAQFGSAEGNFAWNEFTVANGDSDSAVNLNRKVSAQGTKTSGQTWTVDLQITLS